MNVTDENLKMLFQAFGENNDTAFYRIAESIIANELAANHHTFANELRRSLGQNKLMQNNSKANKLTALPKDRRYGDELVFVQESKIDCTKIVFVEKTKIRIERILTEYQKRKQLAKYGFSPKSKLLFWGPPGCGKTLTASYIAHELGLPIGIVRLNAVISSFLGDTASHLQRVFDLANSTPMVLLIDEVDAIGKNRDDANDVGELKRVVNGLLQAIDFFTSSRSIIVAASNHQYLLDPALWRRFDDIIHFPIPGSIERKRYLSLLLNGVHHSGSLGDIITKMDELSFADIEKITIESLKTMVLAGRKELMIDDLLDQIEIHRENLKATKNGN
jgi:SpoVK/Ycf46/Vps4 family AAA+-type ATPase